MLILTHSFFWSKTSVKSNCIVKGQNWARETKRGLIFPSTLWTPETGSCLIMMVELHSQWHCTVRSLIFLPHRFDIESLTQLPPVENNITGLISVAWMMFILMWRMSALAAFRMFMFFLIVLWISVFVSWRMIPIKKFINQGKFTSVARATIFCNKSVAAMDQWPAKITKTKSQLLHC